MIGKCKSLVMFVAVVGVACIALNSAGMNTQAYAQDAATTKSADCPLDKGGKCSSDTGSKQKSKCNKSGCHKIKEMMNLVQCAKKELLKEKIKANLEKKIGSKLDKIADLLVDAMLDECRSEMKSKVRSSALENRIREVFTGKEEQ